MRYTENFLLNLPGDSDPLEIAKLSENFERLDAAVAAAAGDSSQVGDILYTLRSDLGGGWLPCNGASFDPGKYPDLAKLGLDVVSAAGYATAANWHQSIGIDDRMLDSEPYSLATDGETIAFTAKYYDGNVLKTLLFYTDDGFQTVRYKGAMGAGANNNIWSAVFYVNGYWILQNTSRVLYVTRDLKNEDGSTLLEGGKIGIDLTDGSVLSVGYVDGEYYIACLASSGPYIYHSDSPGFNSNGGYYVPMTNYVTATSWKFANTEKYSVWVGFKSNRITDIVYTDVLYSSDLSSHYKEVHVYDTADMRNISNLDVEEDRIFWAYNTASTGSNGQVGICRIDSIPAGTVKHTPLNNLPSDLQSSFAYMRVSRISGYYTIATERGLITVRDLSDGGSTDHILYSDLTGLSSGSDKLFGSKYSAVLTNRALLLLLGGGTYSFIGAGTASRPDRAARIPLHISAVPDIDLPQGGAYIKASGNGGFPGGDSSNDITSVVLQSILQQLDRKGDTLSYDGTTLTLLSGSKPLSTVQVVEGGGASEPVPEPGGENTGSGGSSGTFDHSKLYQRSAPDQHPISAITGLDEMLADLSNKFYGLSGGYNDLSRWVVGLSENLNNLSGDLERIPEALTTDELSELLAVPLEEKTACLVIPLANGTEQRTDLKLIPHSAEFSDYSLTYSGEIPFNMFGVVTLNPPEGYAFTGLYASWQPALRIGSNYHEGNLSADGSILFYIPSSSLGQEFTFVSTGSKQSPAWLILELA